MAYPLQSGLYPAHPSIPEMPPALDTGGNGNTGIVPPNFGGTGGLTPLPQPPGAPPFHSLPLNPTTQPVSSLPPLFGLPGSSLPNTTQPTSTPMLLAGMGTAIPPGTGLTSARDAHQGPTGVPGAPGTPGLPGILSALNGANTNPAALANQYMASILGQDNPYIRDARQRGMEQANARGMLNSNMAAGASERSAIEAAQPLFNAAMGLNSQREQQGWQTGERLGTQAWQANQNQYDRQLKTKLQSDAAFQQDWLSSQNFSRQFNGALAMLPINSSSQFMQMIQQYAIENPEIYTPSMISGMNNFFTQSMSQLLAQFFPNLGRP